MTAALLKSSRLQQKKFGYAFESIESKVIVSNLGQVH